MISRLISRRRGAAGVEAAILWPILIVMVIGFMEFALLLFTYSSMQAAAREVTRQLALNVTAPAQAADEIDSRMLGGAEGARAFSI